MGFDRFFAEREKEKIRYRQNLITVNRFRIQELIEEKERIDNKINALQREINWLLEEQKEESEKVD